MNQEEYNNIINLYNNKQITREDFESKIKTITKDILSPLKEYYRLACYFQKYYYVPKDKRDNLINNSLILLESNLLNENQKNIIKCAILNAAFSEYNYDLAETYANDLLSNKVSDEIILYHLAEYYTKTRRYDIASNIYNKLKNVSDNPLLEKSIETYENIIKGTRKEYIPSKKENIEKYILFMNSIGININRPKSQPDKISKDDYPIPEEIKENNFNTFIAFDVETTGIDHSKDAITELSAIKVVNGQIIEEKEFIFQELVHPYKRKIPKIVENLTGITNDMVKDAPQIWEVFPKFVNFIEDNILVGYNCMTFDSKFLVRAGRLSNLVINNKYFDVMHMAKKNKNIINSKNMTLTEVARSLGIENPQAHRALADSITTAKVYLKLLEIEK